VIHLHQRLRSTERNRVSWRKRKVAGQSDVNPVECRRRVTDKNETRHYPLVFVLRTRVYSPAKKNCEALFLIGPPRLTAG